MAKKILDENLNEIVENEQETVRVTLELSKETADMFDQITKEYDMKKKEIADILLRYAIANIKKNEVKEEK